MAVQPPSDPRLRLFAEQLAVVLLEGALRELGENPNDDRRPEVQSGRRPEDGKNVAVTRHREVQVEPILLRIRRKSRAAVGSRVECGYPDIVVYGRRMGKIS